MVIHLEAKEESLFSLPASGGSLAVSGAAWLVDTSL